jgi:hypothetical protein
MGVDRHKPVFQLYRETQEYQTCREKFEQVGSVPFLEKFKGYHEGVSLYFAQTYDRESVQFGAMKLTISEATIEKSISFPSSGEKYFNGVIIDIKLCQNFLRLEHQDPNWTKGIPRSCIKEDY